VCRPGRFRDATGKTLSPIWSQAARLTASSVDDVVERHQRIIGEPDESRQKFLFATAAVVRRELTRVLATMGISVPPVM